VYIMYNTLAYSGQSLLREPHISWLSVAMLYSMYDVGWLNSYLL
jgi:hypothetical protein